MAIARSPGFQLTRCWLTCIALAGTDLVFQMPRERAQPLEAEIPLALRQLRDVTPPGVSPLAEDADVVLSLRFYFLTARTPLATAQVQHLSRLDRATAAAGTYPPCLMLAPLLLPPSPCFTR